MRLRTIALWLGLLLWVAAPAAAGMVSGPAEVTDGDTLTVGAAKIRLHGIDAPETAQRCALDAGGEWDCGQAAGDRLAALVAGRKVYCTPHDRDAYGRLVATCAVEGIDLGGVLVSEGLAWAYTRFSADYAALEGRARRQRVGLWRGAAQPAWDYRADWAVAAGRASEEPGPKGCAIKGNITASGERVYHTPDSPWYRRTRVEEKRGEHWFCDAAEAEAAGWRAAAGGRFPKRATDALADR